MAVFSLDSCPLVQITRDGYKISHALIDVVSEVVIVKYWTLNLC